MFGLQFFRNIFVPKRACVEWPNGKPFEFDDMKTCPWCGKQYPDDAVVCAIDGKPLTPEFLKLPLDEVQKEWIEKSIQWLFTSGKIPVNAN